MIKLTISGESAEEVRAFIKTITYPVKRVKRPQKRPESAYYKVYIWLEMPPTSDEKKP